MNKDDIYFLYLIALMLHTQKKKKKKNILNEHMCDYLQH